MNLNIREMLPKERDYAYTQSYQLMSQSGCIALMRGDFGNGGRTFYPDYEDQIKQYRITLSVFMIFHRLPPVSKHSRLFPLMKGLCLTPSFINAPCRFSLSMSSPAVRVQFTTTSRKQFLFAAD